MALLNGNSEVSILKSSPNFSIYSLNGNAICLFVVPETVNGNRLSLYLDLNNKSNYDSLLAGAMTKEQVVSKIEEDYTVIAQTYPSGIYVLPNFDIHNLDNVLKEGNDKQAIFNAINGVGADTKKIQSILALVGVSLDPSIHIVEKSNTDVLFANWLVTQNMGNGVSFEELKSKTQVVNNPFMSVSSTDSNPFTSVSNEVSPNMQSFPSNSSEGTDSVQQSIPSSTVVSQQPVNFQNTQAIPVPTPVEGVSLQATNIDNTRGIPTQVSEDSKVKVRKLGNKGYVNIVILMAILVGVTMLSIQLGKFLYSVYG